MEEHTIRPALEEKLAELCDSIVNTKPTNPLDQIHGVVSIRKDFLVQLIHQGFYQGLKGLDAGNCRALFNNFDPRLNKPIVQILHLLYQRLRGVDPNEQHKKLNKLSPTMVTVFLLKYLMRPLLIAQHPHAKTKPGIILGDRGLDDVLEKLLSAEANNIPLTDKKFADDEDIQAYLVMECKVVADQVKFGLISHFELYISVSENNEFSWHASFLKQHIHDIYELYRLFLDLKYHYKSLGERIPEALIDPIKAAANVILEHQLGNNITNTQKSILDRIFGYQKNGKTNFVNKYFWTHQPTDKNNFDKLIEERVVNCTKHPRSDHEKTIYTILKVKDDPFTLKGKQLFTTLMFAYKGLKEKSNGHDNRDDIYLLCNILTSIVMLKSENSTVRENYLKWIRSQELVVCRHQARQNGLNHNISQDDIRVWKSGH